MRTWIYGVGHPVGHEQTYKRVFMAHNEAVQNYFSKRRNDLLVMDITEGDGAFSPMRGRPPAEAAPFRRLGCGRSAPSVQAPERRDRKAGQRGHF